MTELPEPDAELVELETHQAVSLASKSAVELPEFEDEDLEMPSPKEILAQQKDNRQEALDEERALNYCKLLELGDTAEGMLASGVDPDELSDYGII